MSDDILRSALRNAHERFGEIAFGHPHSIEIAKGGVARTRDALAAPREAAPEGPWTWRRDSEGGTMAYFKRATDGWNFYAHFTEAEAIAVRDTLNRVAAQEEASG